MRTRTFRPGQLPMAATNGASSEPVLADVPYPVEMEPNLVIEYYSR